jgi:DNA-3-methyladenine glycosylase II
MPDPADPAIARLRAADPLIAAFLDRSGAPEPRPRQGDPLASLARAIVFQQLATRAASAIHARFVTAIGGTVTAAAILATSPETLRAVGLSTAKTRSLLDLAEKVGDGSVPLGDLDPLPDDDIVERLTAVRGIGRWTAEMFLLFELRRPDVWPVDDLGVRHGWRLIHHHDGLLAPKALLAEGERFRPYRSTLALLCYHAVHLARGTTPPP